MLTRGWVRVAVGLVLGLLGGIGLLRLLVFPVTTGVERPAETAFEMELRDMSWINGAWSPSGDQLLILGDKALHLVDLNTHLARPLSPHGLFANRHIWSPNGQYVAYTLSEYASDVGQVIIQDVFSGETREFPVNANPLFYLEWSLDSSAVIFHTYRTLWRYSLADDRLEDVYTDQGSRGLWNIGQSWLSPDRRYAVVPGSTLNEATGTIQDTWLDFVDLTTGRIVLTIDTELRNKGLVWSDDSQYFAFIDIQASGGREKLKIVDRLTGKQCGVDVVSGSQGYLLDWSSGNELLWRERQGMITILHRVRAADCSNREVLRSDNWAGWGLWSPDARTIGVTWPNRLTLIDAALNSVVDYAVQNANVWIEPPVWSPDSRYVAANVYPGCLPAVEMVIIDVETGEL